MTHFLNHTILIIRSISNVILLIFDIKPGISYDLSIVLRYNARFIKPQSFFNKISSFKPIYFFHFIAYFFISSLIHTKPKTTMACYMCFAVGTILCRWNADVRLLNIFWLIYYIHTLAFTFIIPQINVAQLSPSSYLFSLPPDNGN